MSLNFVRRWGVVFIILCIVTGGGLGVARGVPPSAGAVPGVSEMLPSATGLSLGELRSRRDQLIQETLKCLKLKQEQATVRGQKFSLQIHDWAVSSGEGGTNNRFGNVWVGKFLNFFQNKNNDNKAPFAPGVNISKTVQKPWTTLFEGLPTSPAEQCEGQVQVLADGILEGIPKQFPPKALFAPYLDVVQDVLFAKTLLLSFPIGVTVFGQEMVEFPKSPGGDIDFFKLPLVTFGKAILASLSGTGANRVRGTIKAHSDYFDFLFQFSGRDVVKYTQAFPVAVFDVGKTLQDAGVPKLFLLHFLNLVYPQAMADYVIGSPVSVPAYPEAIFALRADLFTATPDKNAAPALLEVQSSLGKRFTLNQDHWGIWVLDPLRMRPVKVRVDPWELIETRILNAELKGQNCSFFERMQSPVGKCPVGCMNPGEEGPATARGGPEAILQNAHPSPPDTVGTGNLPVARALNAFRSPFGSPTMDSPCDPNSGGGGGGMLPITECMGRTVGKGGKFSPDPMLDRIFTCTKASLTGGFRFSFAGSGMPGSDNPMCKVINESEKEAPPPEPAEPVSGDSEPDSAQDVRDEKELLPATVEELINQTHVETQLAYVLASELRMRVPREADETMRNVVGRELRHTANLMASGYDRNGDGQRDPMVLVETWDRAEAGGEGYTLSYIDGHPVVWLHQDTVREGPVAIRESLMRAAVALTLDTLASRPLPGGQRQNLLPEGVAQDRARGVMDTIMRRLREGGGWSCTDDASCGGFCNLVGMERRKLLDCLTPDSAPTVRDICKLALCEEEYLATPGLEACAPMMEDPRNCDAVVFGSCNPCVVRCEGGTVLSYDKHATNAEAAQGCCASQGSGGGTGSGGGNPLCDSVSPDANGCLPLGCYRGAIPPPQCQTGGEGLPFPPPIPGGGDGGPE